MNQKCVHLEFVWKKRTKVAKNKTHQHIHAESKWKSIIATSFNNYLNIGIKACARRNNQYPSCLFFIASLLNTKALKLTTNLYMFLPWPMLKQI